MANSARRTVNYKPRMTDAEAYEKLHPEIRRALQDAVTEWSAYGAYRYERKNGRAATIAWLRKGDEQFIAKGWEPARGKKPAVKSPSLAARVKPLRANWSACL